MSIITKPNARDQFIEEGTVLTEDQLNLRAFLLGSFWRNDIPITERSYRFCDNWIKNEDADIASKENADTLLKEAYETFK
tara:strand:- start:2540 stop:2779 length:240 start_codon:yes stop_codon:yes gene_type:complete